MFRRLYPISGTWFPKTPRNNAAQCQANSCSWQPIKLKELTRMSDKDKQQYGLKINILLLSYYIIG